MLGANGRFVARVIAASSARIASTDNSAHGSEPRPPAFDTAIASALSCTPAIGAWTIGNSIPRSVVIDGIRVDQCTPSRPNDDQAGRLMIWRTAAIVRSSGAR